MYGNFAPVAGREAQGDPCCMDGCRQSALGTSWLYEATILEESGVVFVGWTCCEHLRSVLCALRRILLALVAMHAIKTNSGQQRQGGHGWDQHLASRDGRARKKMSLSDRVCKVSSYRSDKLAKLLLDANRTHHMHEPRE